jgi:hypothetical protein
VPNSALSAGHRKRTCSMAHDEEQAEQVRGQQLILGAHCPLRQTRMEAIWGIHSIHVSFPHTWEASQHPALVRATPRAGKIIGSGILQ